MSCTGHSGKNSVEFMLIVAKRAKKIDPTFGQRLRKFREEQGYTLKEIGERAEMPYQSVQRLERSEREPTYSTILKLAEALGVTPQEFFVGTGGDGD